MSNFFKTKSVKPVSTDTTFTLDFTRFLGPQLIASITYVTATGITILSSSISADNLKVLFTVSGGAANTEYLVSIRIHDNVGNVIDANNVVLVTNVQNCNYYGNTFSGDDYFALNLNSENWNAATMQQKIAAMLQATRAIDRLNLVGNKLVATQPMQFPRNSIPVFNTPTVPFPVDYDYPNDIEFATYEEAIMNLDDTDTQDEINNAAVLMEQLGAAKVQYDRSFIADNLRSGIISNSAWDYLHPYIRDNKEINLNRVS